MKRESRKVRSSSTLLNGESPTLLSLRSRWLTLMGRHGVEDPECEEHYDKFGRDYSEDEDDDESGDGSDSYGYGCNQGCCAFGPGYD